MILVNLFVFHSIDKCLVEYICIISLLMFKIFYFCIFIHDISIKGRGILTLGEWKHESIDPTWLRKHAAIDAAQISYLQMEGIIIANACGYTIPIWNSNDNTHDNQFRNLKLISWNGNTDGIWVNGKNHIVDDCFIA